MAMTRTGVKITLDFLRRDKKNIAKLTRLARLKREGKLTERGEKAFARCIHKHEYRYGDGWRTRTPEENAKMDQASKELRASIEAARKHWLNVEKLADLAKTLLTVK